MREIKFRAWGRELGSNNMYMCKPFELKKYVTYHEGAQSELYPFVGDDTVWMQYTGLKDKNGREIYEGDIITATTNHDLKMKPHFVEYVDNIAAYVARCDRAIMLMKDVKDFKVIGNIYENPELLESK